MRMRMRTIMIGPELGPHFVRACAVEMHWHFTRATFNGNLQEKYRAPEAGPTLVRGRNALRHFTRATFNRNLQENSAPQNEPSPERRHTHCASLRNRNALRHFTRATWYGNLQEKCRVPEWAQNADTHFARASAAETHGKISQEALDMEICRQNAAAQSEHPDQAPNFTPIVRTPQWGHAVCGKINEANLASMSFWCCNLIFSDVKPIRWN